MPKIVLATAEPSQADVAVIVYIMVIVANIRMSASRMMTVVGEADASILMPLPRRENSASANWDISAPVVLKVSSITSSKKIHDESMSKSSSIVSHQLDLSLFVYFSQETLENLWDLFR